MIFTLLDNCVGKQCAVQCRSGKCIQHNFCYHNQKWKVVCSLQARLKCTADIKIYYKLSACKCVYGSLDSAKKTTEVFFCVIQKALSIFTVRTGSDFGPQANTGQWLLYFLVCQVKHKHILIFSNLHYLKYVFWLFYMCKFDSSHGQWPWTHSTCLFSTWLWSASFIYFL